MKRLAVGIVLAGLCGCGGGLSHVPCSGSDCVQVAGTYDVVVTQRGGPSCQTLRFEDTDGQSVAAIRFKLTQQGNQLAFRVVAGILPLTATGTLFADRTVEFEQRFPHREVTQQRTGEHYDYASDNILDLTFIPSTERFTVVGSLREALTATGATDLDRACTLGANLTATLHE